MTIHDDDIWGADIRGCKDAAVYGFVLQVVLVDFAATLTYFALRQTSGAFVFSGSNTLALAVLFGWATVMVLTGAFTIQTVTPARAVLNVRCWAVTAVGLFAMAILGAGLEPLRNALALVTFVALIDAGVRFVLARGVPLTVVAVVPPGTSSALVHDHNAKVIQLELSDELLSAPGALIEHVSAAVKSGHASVVEIPADSGIPVHVLRNLSWELRKLNVSIRLVVLGRQFSSSRIRTQVRRGHVLVNISAPRPAPLIRWGKRLMDLLGSAVLITLLSPLLLLLAVIIAAPRNGTVIYKQERIGLEGKPFQILKFRSMTPGADAQLAELLREQGTAGKPLFKVDDDPRITRAGKVMRKYSLDELPQLFNVFGGSMALVGPRPQRGAEVALYDEVSAQRLGVPPGMTGMWQVGGRSRLTWEEAIELDIYYAHNWNLAKDVSILFKTFKAVVGGDGAV